MAFVYSYVYFYIKRCKGTVKTISNFSILFFIFLLYIEEKIDRPEATGSPKQSKFSPMVIASLGAMAIGGMALISSAGPALQVRKMCL